MSDRRTPAPGFEDEGFDSTLTEQPLAAAQPTPVPESTDTPVDVKATGTRAPSRSTRILLGALLLALAAFIWFNYIWQPEQPQVLVNGNGTRLNGGLAAGAVNGVVPVVAGDAVPRQDLPVIPGNNAVTPPLVAAGSEDDAAGGQTATEGGVVVLPLPGVVARDLEIVELPFLVTQPPAQQVAEDAPADEESVTRPVAVRASVNPFSPVVLSEPDVTAAADFAPPATLPSAPLGPQVMEVSIPDGPDQSAITTIAPPGGVTADRPSTATPAPPAAPPVAPPPQVTPVAVPVPSPSDSAAAAAPGQIEAGSGQFMAQSLPRPLPGPALSPVPSVLQERRTVESVPQPNLAQVTAVEEPVGEIDASVADRTPDEDGAAPEVLPPVSTRVMPSDADPLVAGITPLSRYLRDYDVTFTGMVLGPVSQGVFRSSTSPRPVVVGLGQTLPETEITLTDLRGQQAEFTLADASQYLTLDLRR